MATLKKRQAKIVAGVKDVIAKRVWAEYLDDVGPHPWTDKELNLALDELIEFCEGCRPRKPAPAHWNVGSPD